MVDYHPSYVFMRSISSDVGANYNTSDATIVTIHSNAAQLSVVKTSDYHYDMNNHVLMSFSGICSSAENTNQLHGYIQRRMMESSGAAKVSLCMSSDTIVAYYLWNSDVAV